MPSNETEFLESIIKDRMTLGLLAGSFLVALANNVVFEILWFIAFLLLYVNFLEKIRMKFTAPPYPSAWNFGLSLTWTSLKVFAIVVVIVGAAGSYVFYSGLLPNPFAMLGDMTNTEVNVNIDLTSMLRPFITPLFVLEFVFYALTFASFGVLVWQGNAKKTTRRSLSIFTRDIFVLAGWTLLILAPSLLRDPLSGIPSMQDIMNQKLPEQHFSIWPVISAVVYTGVSLLAPVHLALRYGKRLKA